MDTIPLLSELERIREELARLTLAVAAQSPAPAAVRDSAARARGIRLWTAVQFDVRPEALTARIRTQRLAWARHVGMFLCVEIGGATCAETAREFCRHRSDVSIARRRVKERCETDGEHGRQVAALTVKLKLDLQR